MGTSRYTNYGSVNWDIPIWSPDWKQVDSLLTGQEQGYQLAQQALNAPIDSSSYGNDPLLREQLRLNRQQAQNDLALTYKSKGVNAGNKALQSYIQQIQQEKQPGGVEYQLMQNKAAIAAYNEKIDKAEKWSPEEKKLWFALNMTNYKGSLEGADLKGFSGQDISKFIDLSEKARNLMKEMIPKTTEGFMDSKGNVVLNTGGRAVYSNGYEFFWDKAKKIQLTPQEMISAVLPSLESDVEAQSYLKDKSKIKLFGTGLTENNYQPLLEQKKLILTETISKIDTAKTEDEKRNLISSITGASLDDLKQYKAEELDTYLKKYKSEYELEKIKTSNIKSFNDLVEYEKNNDLQKIVKDNSQIYKRDDFHLTPEHWLDQFSLEALKNSYKKKEGEGEEIPIDKEKLWMEEGFVANEKMPFDVKNIGDYDKLVTSINKGYSEIAKKSAQLNYDYNLALKDPKNPTGQILREAGWNPERDGDFIQMKTDPQTGLVYVQKQNWDKLGILDGEKQQKINEINKNFEEQSAKLNSLRSEQLAYISLYQKYTGDLNIYDNLKDIKEGVLVNPKANLKSTVEYKKLYEKVTEKPKSARDFAEQVLDNTFNVNSKKEEIDKFFAEHYDDYVKYMKAKGKTPVAISALTEKLEYNSNGTILSPLTQLAWKEDEVFKDILAKKLEPQFKQIVSEDKSYNEKRAKYDADVEKFKETLLTPGRSYYVSDLAFEDSKLKKVARETKNELGRLINDKLLNYQSLGQVGNVMYLDGFTPISDKDELDRIAKGLAQFKPDDVDDETKNAQQDKVRYSIKVVNGKMYGVAQINFDEKQRLQGKDTYATNVMFEITDEHQSLKSWLIQDQRLFSEQSLAEKDATWKDLKTTAVSNKTYYLPNSRVGIAVNRRIDVSNNNTGYYNVNLFKNEGKVTDDVIKLETNNPYLGIEIKDYAHQLSVRKNELATIKQLQFGGDENGFRDFVMREVNEKAGGKINQTTLNNIYEWIIKPEIKDGKVMNIGSPGNFPNPQGFKW